MSAVIEGKVLPMPGTEHQVPTGKHLPPAPRRPGDDAPVYRATIIQPRGPKWVIPVIGTLILANVVTFTAVGIKALPDVGHDSTSTVGSVEGGQR